MSLALDAVDHLLARLQTGGSAFASPLALAQHLDPGRIRRTPALDVIDQELTRLADTPDGRLIVSVPPQQGKSFLCSRFFPLWLLTRNPEARIAIASFEHSIARRWGRMVRDDIATHSDLGLRVRSDVASQAEWQLADSYGGVVTVGIGGALTGRPVDGCLIIDDPVKDRAQADSPTFRDRAWDWWTDVGSTRLHPGTPVVVVLTRWHEDDLAGRLQNGPDSALWRVVNLPAQANRPDDPLGRQIGEYMESTIPRTREQWEAVKVQAGSHTWASLYQGEPAPDTGVVFDPKWWRFWTELPDRFDQELTSWDLTFTGSESSDWVVGQHWGIKGPDRYLIDQVRGRWGFVETLDEMRRFCTRAPLHLVEKAANGAAAIDTLKREISGIVAVKPTEHKDARARAVSPEVESGHVLLPDPASHPWVSGLLAELKAGSSGAHDDQHDALTQALKRFQGSLFREPARVARLEGRLPM